MLELPPVRTQNLTADLTALLDVLFIVLVFLLLSVAVKLNVLEVSLPSAGESGEVVLEQPPKVISLTYSQGEVSYALDEQPFSAEHTLIQAVAPLDQTQPIYLAVDKRVPSEDLVGLFAELSKIEVAIANIVVKSE